MRALAYLLGARALDATRTQHPQRNRREPDSEPFASTPDRARAWRAWAEAGRSSSRPAVGSSPAIAPRRLMARPRPVPGDGAA